MDVYLRALEITDHQQINGWRRDPALYELTVGNTNFVSSETDRKWIEKKIQDPGGGELYLAICDKPSNRMVGYLSVNNIDWRNRRADWGGILIGDAERRRDGGALQAAYLMLVHVFDELHLHRLTGYWLKEHRASLTLGQMLGFQQEGVWREHVFKQGRYHDAIVMSLLAEEFAAVRDKITAMF